MVMGRRMAVEADSLSVDEGTCSGQSSWLFTLRAYFRFT